MPRLIGPLEKFASFQRAPNDIICSSRTYFRSVKFTETSKSLCNYDQCNHLSLMNYRTERGLSVGEKSKGIPIFEAGGIRHKGTQSPEVLTLKHQTWTPSMVPLTLKFRSNFMRWKCKLQCWITWPYIYTRQPPLPKRYWSQILHPLSLIFQGLHTRVSQLIFNWHAAGSEDYTFFSLADTA